MTDQFTENASELIRWMVQANQHRQALEYRKALNIYHKLTEEFGETSGLDQSLASCYFHLGLDERDEDNFRKAVIWITRAIALLPNNSQLYYFLGWYHSSGTLNYEAAIQAFRTAIEINPNNVHALVSGAFLYGVPEDVITLDKAIVWLERAVQLEPDNPNYHYNLGMLQNEAGQLFKAEQEWMDALSCSRPLEASLSMTIMKRLGSA